MNCKSPEHYGQLMRSGTMNSSTLSEKKKEKKKEPKIKPRPVSAQFSRKSNQGKFCMPTSE